MTTIELIMPKILFLFLQPFFLLFFFFKYLQSGVPSPTPGLLTIPQRKGGRSLQLVCITKMIFLRQGLQPARLFCQWDFPGENIRVGYHFLLQRIFPTRRLDLHLLPQQASSLPVVSTGKPFSDTDQVIKKSFLSVSILKGMVVACPTVYAFNANPVFHTPIKLY